MKYNDPVITLCDCGREKFDGYCAWCEDEQYCNEMIWWEQTNTPCMECGGKDHCRMNCPKLQGEDEMLDQQALHKWELDNEACPGCGCCPGDGITMGCDDPNGCGHWKEMERELYPERLR